MHGTARTALALATVAVAGHALPAAGQDAALRELVEAVVGGELMVGALPPDSPIAGAIPEGARIPGTLVQTWGSAAVLGMRGDEALVEGRVRDALVADGWTAPVVERGGRSPCEAVRMTAGDSYLPELVLPPGAQMTGGGSMHSSGDAQETQANLDTPMAVADLAGHFARQAERQGWEPTTEREDAIVALRTFTKGAEHGRRLHGMLLIIAPPGVGGRMATFRVTPLTGMAR